MYSTVCGIYTLCEITLFTKHLCYFRYLYVSLNIFYAKNNKFTVVNFPKMMHLLYFTS